MHGGDRTNEAENQGSQTDPNGTPRSSEGLQEVDRPDLEIEIDGKKIMIDLDLIEWISIGVIIILGAILLR